MQHAEQVDILRELRSFVEDRTTDVAGADGEYLNPADHYTDPERFTLETKRVFEAQPVVVGHLGEFPEHGSFKTVTIGDVAVLVVRDGDEIVAYRNVCQHRGTILVEAEAGKARTFACPYHAWTFGCDGALRHMPDDYGFPGVKERPQDFGLPRLWLGVHAGFVFVRADGREPDEPLAESLDEVGDDLLDMGLESYVKQDKRTTDYHVNWKLPFDIFLENYHTKYTHKNTIFQVFLPNVAKYHQSGRHIRCVLPRRSIGELDEGSTESWDIVEQATILYYIWPNTMLAVLPEHAAVWHVFPRDVGTSTLDFTALLSRRAAGAPEESEKWLKSLKVVYKVKREDSERFVSIQKGLDSGGIRNMVFGRFEKAIGWFHRSVDGALGDESLAGRLRR